MPMLTAQDNNSWVSTDFKRPMINARLCRNYDPILFCRVAHDFSIVCSAHPVFEGRIVCFVKYIIT